MEIQKVSQLNLALGPAGPKVDRRCRRDQKRRRRHFGFALPKKGLVLLCIGCASFWNNRMTYTYNRFFSSNATQHETVHKNATKKGSGTFCS